MFEDKKKILENNIKDSFKEINNSKETSDDKYLKYYNAKKEYKDYIIEEELEIERIRERIRSSYKYQVALAWVDLCEKTTEKVIDVYKKLTKKK